MKIAVLSNASYESTNKVIEKIKFLGATALVNGSHKELIKNCDTVITIGGDGTIIHAAKHAAIENKPIMGINQGRLGFVTEIELNELNLLENIINKNYTIEKRSILEINVFKENKKQTFLALNDFVISRDVLSKIIDIEVLIKNKVISTCRADGIVVATPTGSTAYSLSANGPIVDPTTKNIILTHVCPHTVFSRSVVFNENTTLSLKATSKDNNKISLIIDGEKSTEINKNNIIQIKNSSLHAKFIKIKNKNFYEIFSTKLMKKNI